jgi:hypothetical protein
VLVGNVTAPPSDGVVVGVVLRGDDAIRIRAVPVDDFARPGCAHATSAVNVMDKAMDPATATRVSTDTRSTAASRSQSARMTESVGRLAQNTRRAR